MKQYRVEKLVVCKISDIISAKNETNAAKAMEKRQRKLDLDIEFVIPLDDLGVYVKEIRQSMKRGTRRA